MCKLSIVTINYNNARGLEKTIDSVINQVYEDIEYIIIDGGSTDDSITVIKENEKYINYWVSEPDTGIYNAMNKGIMFANGEYIMMLNSGDYLVDNNILKQIPLDTSESDIIYGNVLWKDISLTFQSRFSNKLTFQFFRNGSIAHQAAFVRKSVHNLIGLYDENYKIISDWKFFLLAVCKYNRPYEYVPLIISVCGCDGISWRQENLSAVHQDRNEVLHKEFPAFVQDYLEMDRLRPQSASNSDFLIKVKGKIKRLLS